MTLTRASHSKANIAHAIAIDISLWVQHHAYRDLVGVNPARVGLFTALNVVLHTRDAAQLHSSRTYFDPQPRTVHHHPIEHPIE